jgi:F-type H+-transporting ATPase subunit delta
MSVNRIASRYAKSLLQLSLERGQLEVAQEDMATFRSALASRDFYLMLKSPLVHGDKKISILTAIFAGKISDLTLEFFKICIRKGREEFLPEMADAFAAQYRILKNILSVRIISASPLEAGVQDQIGQQLKSSGLATGEIQWDLKVDPSLIGGFVLELDDKRYDASVSHKLDQYRKEIRQKVTI